MHTIKLVLAMLIILPILVLPSPAGGDVTLPVCSDAVHAGYTTTGPDGHTYATWHPQIDAEHGCYFDHEHGANPDLVSPGYRPIYGYSAGAMGMVEGHAGFKGYAFRLGGYTWYITHHFGTGNAALAACVRYHTVDIAVWDASGVRVADTHIMADFGASVANGSGADLVPAACPTQAQDAASSSGQRQLPVLTTGNIGYEPWRVGTLAPLPFWQSGGMTFNTPNAQTACDTEACAVNVARTDAGGPARGTYRFLTFNDSHGGFHLHATPIYQNTFTWAGASQYLAPGLDITLPPAACQPYDAHAYWYDCADAPHDEVPFRMNPLITGAN